MNKNILVLKFRNLTPM